MVYELALSVSPKNGTQKRSVSAMTTFEGEVVLDFDTENAFERDEFIRLVAQGWQEPVREFEFLHGEITLKSKEADEQAAKQQLRQERQSTRGNQDRNLTDMGNGERFAAEHGGRVKYIFSWNQWYVWNGELWEPNANGEIERLAKQTARGIYAEAADCSERSEQKEVARWAFQSQSSFRLQAMMGMARSEQPIPMDHETLDSDPWLLNCENGVVDLKTGELRDHDPGDFLSMTTGISYPKNETPSPVWGRFLNETFCGNESLIEFIQRLCGVALVGKVFEHILPFSYGVGSNGKTVFWDAVCNSMGDYGMHAPQGLLMKKRFQSHSTELADLFRKRLVIEAETDDGAMLNESLVKSLTGGDSIRARRMRQDNFEFKPSHTLSLISNYRPVVKGRDVGMWRRLLLIEFNAQVAPENQDAKLPDKLREEYPAILRWMVQGCIGWQQGGLQEPDEVKLATATYKADQDVIGAFISESCLVGGEYRVKCGTLYECYKSWTNITGDACEKNRKFRASLLDRGFETVKNDTNWWLGITLIEG